MYMCMYVCVCVFMYLCVCMYLCLYVLLSFFRLSRHAGYVDLTLPSSEISELKVQVTPPQDNITEMSTGATIGTEKNDKEEEYEGSPVKYAQLAEFQKQIRDQMEDKYVRKTCD